MKRPQGPSLYFATDKNIFEALTQRKVDAATIRTLFQERNIVVSKKTPRDELARYFARLNHDFDDHQRIAGRLGIVSRRERITSVDVSGVTDIDDLSAAISLLKSQREALGDVVQVSREAENLTVTIQYTSVDYSRTEFSQVQTRDGIVEFIKSDDGYTIRSTQNEYVSGARDELLSSVEKATLITLGRKFVSMIDIAEAKMRTRFFERLMDEIPGFRRVDVLAMFIYKPRPIADEDAAEEDDSNDEVDTHVERISMRGVGVSRSDVLQQMLKNEHYYVTKVQFTISRIVSTGAVYEIEAGFEDPKECTGFSFILTGVYAVEDGVVSKKRRPPYTAESDDILRQVDSHSRSVVAAIRQVAMAGGSGEA